MGKKHNTLEYYNRDSKIRDQVKNNLPKFLKLIQSNTIDMNTLSEHLDVCLNELSEGELDLIEGKLQNKELVNEGS